MKRTFQSFGTGTVAISDFEEDGVRCRLDQISGDPETVYRLYIERFGCSVEICPSKGLSIRDTVLAGRQMFWDAPLPNLPDPSEIDLAGTMLVNGVPLSGMTWVGVLRRPCGNARIT